MPVEVDTFLARTLNNGGRQHAASLCRAAAFIITAPFSAMMVVSAILLVEVSAGTDASMICAPSMTLTRNSLWTTLIGCVPITQGSWHDSVYRRIGAVIQQFVVGLYLRPRQALFADEALPVSPQLVEKGPHGALLLLSQRSDR